MTFLEKLSTLRAQTAQTSDTWKASLELLKGSAGRDKIGRVTTEAIFEHLNVPPLQRTPDACKRLRRLMIELGWTPMRMRSITGRGYSTRVRGYARSIEIE